MTRLGLKTALRSVKDSSEEILNFTVPKQPSNRFNSKIIHNCLKRLHAFTGIVYHLKHDFESFIEDV